VITVSFRFSFAGPSPAAIERVQAAPLEPLEDLEDYEYLVMRGCGALAETDAAFRIGGFGKDDWAFTVGYDMSAFMEELPYLIDALRSGNATEIDLYPQGVERTLTFSPADGLVRVTCESRTSWVPRPDVEVCVADDLLSMCVRLARDFATALDSAVPPIAQLAPFDRWRRGEV
jgi:hypothetical protein